MAERPMVRGNWLDGFLELDWLKTPNLILLSLMFITVRVPMVFLGFGLDPDAWRIANSAFDLRYHLVYHTSRFPGYPLPEFVDSLLVNFGWVGTNSMTMCLSLLSVLAFAYLLKKDKIRNKGLLTVTYAFMPLILINSTNSMDYMWGLSFIVFAWFFLARKRFIIAGMMMGLATSSRPQVMLFIVPMVFLIAGSKLRKTHIIQFLLASFIVSIVSFTPIYMEYGFEFIRYYPARTNLLQSGYGAIKYFGIPSLAVLISIAITSLRNFRMMTGKHSTYDLFVLLSFMVACASFALAPYHFEYLIPMIPFGLILLSRIGKKPLVAIFCCLAVLHGFLTFPSVQHTENDRVNIGAVDCGVVIKNFEARRAQMATAMKITEAAVHSHSVVLVGPWLPVVAYLGKEISSVDGTKKMYDSNIQDQGVWNFRRMVWYRYLIDLDELTLLIDDHFKIYYVEGVREYTLEVYGYHLNEHGTTMLKL